MVPSSFVLLDSLPLTASGKLNRRALPASNDFDDRTAATFAAPQTPLEKLLASIWSDVLNVKAIGINDNFFDLGGHSLLAVSLFARIEEKLGKYLPLAILFRAPTVAQLAAVIQRDSTPEWSSLVPIQPSGSMHRSRRCSRPRAGSRCLPRAAHWAWPFSRSLRNAGLAFRPLSASATKPMSPVMGR